MDARARAKHYLDRLNQSKHGLYLLAMMSFLETIIVPIPIELILIPYMAMNRQRIWLIAGVAMAGCVAGAVLGYGVGFALFESVGRWFIDSFGHEAVYRSYRDLFDDYGFVAILVVGILPIPFQLAMITAGLAGYSLTLFLLATFMARGLRYFGLAWLVARFGERARELWRRHALATGAAAAAVVVAFSLGMRWLAALVV